MEMTVHHVGDMLFESTIGGFTVNADAPEMMFGDNRAPTPPLYLLFALGSCAGVFVEFYCEKTGINTEGLSITVSCDTFDDPERFENFKIMVHLPKEDLKGREDAIIRVAQKCLVGAALENKQKITIELKK